MDSYTSDLAGLWSVSRRLLTSYTGPLIRVRRSSDDAELDIGNVGGALDQSALLSFVGGNSAYIRTVYDQSGLSRDYSQSTNSQQFRIVNSGVVEQNEGVPAARAISASNTCMATPAFAGRTWSATAKMISAIDYAGLLTGTGAIITMIASTTHSLMYPAAYGLYERHNGTSYALGGCPFCYPDTGCNTVATSVDVVASWLWGSERDLPGRYFDGYVHEQAIYSTIPAFLDNVDAVLMNHLGIVA